MADATVVVAVEFELGESTAESVASEPEAESTPAAKARQLQSWPSYLAQQAGDKPASDLLREWTRDQQNF